MPGWYALLACVVPLGGALGCREPTAPPRGASATEQASSSASESGTPSASSAASADALAPIPGSASAGSANVCTSIGATIAATEKRLASQPASCVRDGDCVCYGGPVCANALVTSCPGAVPSAAADALTPLVQAWNDHACGGFLWSPNLCVPRCVGGRCVTHER